MGQLQVENTLNSAGIDLTWADDQYLIVHGFRIARTARYNTGEQSTVLDLIDVHRGQVVWRYAVPFGRVVERGPVLVLGSCLRAAWQSSITQPVGLG